MDDALADEVQRQKARFVQEIMGLDRQEGVGRDDGRRNDSTYRDLDPDRRDDPGPDPFERGVSSSRGRPRGG